MQVHTISNEMVPGASYPKLLACIPLVYVNTHSKSMGLSILYPKGFAAHVRTSRRPFHPHFAKKIAPAAHFATQKSRLRRISERVVSRSMRGHATLLKGWMELVPKAPRRRRRVEVAAEGRYFTCFDARSHARNLEII